MCRLCKKLSQILNPVLNVPKIYHNQSLISYSPLIIEKHIFALATLVHSSTSVVLEGAGRETPVDRCYLTQCKQIVLQSLQERIWHFIVDAPNSLVRNFIQSKKTCFTDMNVCCLHCRLSINPVCERLHTNLCNFSPAEH